MKRSPKRTLPAASALTLGQKLNPPSNAGERGGPGILLIALALAPNLLLACGVGSEAKTPDARIRRDTRIVHEPCDLDAAGAERLDVNGDGRPELTRVLVSKREVCRALDFNFDGRIDAFVYRGSDGSLRRRESDFDRDGRVDEIAVYSGGQLSSRQYATNLAGKLDTWQFFEGAVLKRAERDADGDGVIDQWWEYPRLPASECALVHSDVDGDGRPDPGATVDLCEGEEAEGSPASAAATTESGASPAASAAPLPPPPLPPPPPPAAAAPKPAGSAK
jgi:hypothetical protein